MENNSWQKLLQHQLNWNQAQIKFLVALILALAKLTTVNLAQLANALNGTAKTAVQQQFEIPFLVTHQLEK